MKVRRLNIDFYRKNTTTGIGAAILLAGLLAVSSVAVLHQDLADEVDVLEWKLRKVSSVRQHKPPSPPIPLTDAEYIQTISRQLNLPWERFFQGIEKAADEDVVLLNLHPDAAKGTVRIGGEARNYYAALRSVQALNSGEVFTEVQFLEHEVNQQSAELPVRFTLSARWRSE